MGQKTPLTTGVDAITGTSGNDTITATNTATSAVLGGLDVVDGGAGTDTLAIADTATAANAAFSLPAGFTVKNVEVLKVTTNGSLGDDASAATAFNTTGMTGLTSLEVTTAGDGTTDTSIITADTTDVTLTASAAQDVDVLGGKVVSVTGGATGSTITGAALTSVTVKTSGGMTIDNTDTVANGSTTAVGTTLKSVTLDAVDSNTAIKGKAIDTLTLKNATASTNTVTITNATAAHSLTLNVDGTGYDATATAQTQTVADAQAKSLTINATGAKSNIAFTTGGANTVLTNATITGSAALVVDFDSTNNTKLASIDGSAATGNLTLNNTAVATTIKTGAGDDKFTATVVGTSKATVDSGAGADIVTLVGGLVAGSTVNLGAGNDTLLGTTVVAASTATAVTIIDGGEGTDSVSSLLINAGNAAQFVNFESLSIGAATALDASLLTASTITALTIDGNASGTLTGITKSQNLTVNADNGANGATTLTFSDVTGTADEYTITFNAKTTGTAATPTAISADTISIEGIEAVKVVSGSAGGVNTNSIDLKNANATSLTITGDQALNVTFNTAFGTTGATTGVTTIDGSAATGKLDIDVANVKAAAAGITVKGGSAVDTLTTSTFATTLTGNGGNDVFEVGAAVAGTTDATSAVFTTITDFTNGDTISFAVTAGTTTFTTAKVDVSAAINLDAAMDLATATNVIAGDAAVKWFQYGGNTYVVQDLSASTTLAATDVAVKLTGLLDLSTASVTTGAGADILSWA